MYEVSLNALRAGITIVFLILIDFIIEFLINRNVKDKRKSFKARVLVRYVLFFCFVFFMAKIWVEGFGYLLTFVGVISAALTITQKEYIMNFFGWLIIMWRDLFVEGDYIEIAQHRGYVHTIGALYFTIEEASDVIWGDDKTGRIVRIPNGLIAMHPVVNLTLEKGFVEGKMVFVFTTDSSLDRIRSLIPLLETELKILAAYKRQFILRVQQKEKPLGIQLRIRYLSLKLDQKAIEDKIFDVIMEKVNTHPDLKLSLAT